MTSYVWFVFIWMAVCASADTNSFEETNNGLRGRNLSQNCPTSGPQPNTMCTTEGQTCDFDFVYKPTEERDFTSGDLICKLPYTSCAPRGSCTCTDLGGYWSRALIWNCFSSGGTPCANDLYVAEPPEPEFAYQPCDPNEQTLPST